VIVKLFLANGGVLEISHQFYSLDFPPADFFYFLKRNNPQKEIILVLRKHQRPDCFVFVVAEWNVIWVILCWYTILNQLYFSSFLTSFVFFRRLEIFQKKSIHVLHTHSFVPYLNILIMLWYLYQTQVRSYFTACIFPRMVPRLIIFNSLKIKNCLFVSEVLDT